MKFVYSLPTVYQRFISYFYSSLFVSQHYEGYIQFTVHPIHPNGDSEVINRVCPSVIWSFGVNLIKRDASYYNF